MKSMQTTVELRQGALTMSAISFALGVSANLASSFGVTFFLVFGSGWCAHEALTLFLRWWHRKKTPKRVVDAWEPSDDR